MHQTEIIITVKNQNQYNDDGIKVLLMWIFYHFLNRSCRNEKLILTYSNKTNKNRKQTMWSSKLRRKINEVKIKR